MPPELGRRACGVNRCFFAFSCRGLAAPGMGGWRDGGGSPLWFALALVFLFSRLLRPTLD